MQPGGDPLVLCFVDFVSPAHAATAMDALQGELFIPFTCKNFNAMSLYPLCYLFVSVVLCWAVTGEIHIFLEYFSSFLYTEGIGWFCYRVYQTWESCAFSDMHVFCHYSRITLLCVHIRMCLFDGCWGWGSIQICCWRLILWLTLML